MSMVSLRYRVPRSRVRSANQEVTVCEPCHSTQALDYAPTQSLTILNICAMHRLSKVLAATYATLTLVVAVRGVLADARTGSALTSHLAWQRLPESGSPFSPIVLRPSCDVMSENPVGTVGDAQNILRDSSEVLVRN